ncbi:MAG: flavodoxin domain-containing protein [Anaeroplasmataceae bacterium]|nr:flavodoxin domain-containing protein [Anaeroplasmataceae bacterium]
MVDAIVYTSKCGHTYAYAKALSEELNIPFYTLKEAKKKLPKGTSIIYMSWVKENKIVKYGSALKYHIDCVCAVGILPATEERLGVVRDSNQLYAKLFYLPGGIRKKRLNLFQRITLKSIESNLSFKLLDSGLKKEEALALDAILHNLNYTDLNALSSILNLYKKKDDYIS